MAPEPAALWKAPRDSLGSTRLKGLRLLNRYDVEGMGRKLFETCVPLVFSEPQLDEVSEALPEEQGGIADTGMKAIAAAIAVGVAAAAGAIGMAIAIAKSNESIARQPEAKADIRSSMMLGLVFIETAIIYALIVAILLIFVL